MARSFGVTGAIRQILREAEDSLTSDEVALQLDQHGVLRPLNHVRATLRQRELAGELIANRIDGRLHYTLNPEYKPVRRMSGRDA